MSHIPHTLLSHGLSVRKTWRETLRLNVKGNSPFDASGDGLREPHLSEPNVRRVKQYLRNMKSLVSHRQNLSQSRIHQRKQGQEDEKGGGTNKSGAFGEYITCAVVHLWIRLS